MRISIFGLGYVGAVCAGCLCARGHDVIGVDVSKVKIDLINQGKSPIVEPGLEPLLEQGVKLGLLRGSDDVKAAVMATEMSFVVVGTPSKKNGDLDLVYMESVCREIGEALPRLGRLRGVSFNWKSDTSTEVLGLLAQDVEAVLPQAVGEGPDGWKGIDTTAVLALLVQAVKEQQAMIDALRASLAQRS